MSGKVFISYRRHDDPGFTGRLHDHLIGRYGPENVFLDVDAIPPGVEFEALLTDWINQSDVLLVMIGKDWLREGSPNSGRRIDNPADFVRKEIEAALAAGISILPVLVNGAVFPPPEAMPASLKPLARWNAIQLTHGQFRSDVARLMAALDSILKNASARRQQSEKKARKEAATLRVASLLGTVPDFLVASNNVAVVGPVCVGKTVFCSVLAHEPAAQVSKLEFDIEVEGTSELFPCYEHLRSGEWPTATMPGFHSKIDVILRKRGIFRSKSLKIRLIDTAGGEWSDLYHPDGDVPDSWRDKFLRFYIARLAGLILLAETARVGEDPQETASRDSLMASTFTRAAALYGKKPIALVLTKADREPEIMSSTRALQAYILRTYPILWNSLRAKVSKVSLFAISSTGVLDESDKVKVLKPQNIWEPIIWIANNI